ncbi:hypothetical protein EJB05_00691, partial [Eragrostis curvula]
MEAPLHKSPVPMPPPQKQPDPLTAAVMQHAATVMAMTIAQNAPPMMGREQCPRCASRDTKFCYFNNYNTAQPRHFCRACRRYWTLGGSLRNVPVGGSTRKRPRPARPTRALAAAVATATAATTTTTTSSCGPFASHVAAPAPALTGGLLSSLLLGSAPLLQGFDPGLGQPTDLAQLGVSAVPLLWPPETVLEGDRTEPTPWKAGGGGMVPPPAAALLHEELAAAAPMMDHAGGLLL